MGEIFTKEIMYYKALKLTHTEEFWVAKKLWQGAGEYLLDVGAGSGIFMRLLCSMDYKTYGIDCGGYAEDSQFFSEFGRDTREH
jgi:2-polyprenyl-3-methyl-5-hydroxy-6-metoxy-1,4-benzoquinol methylase